MNPALFDAAFGAAPGSANLPVPVDAMESWQRAVALGGQGRYAAARTELARARRMRASPRVISLTRSTEGSLSRQLGWYREAAEFDGAALILAGDDHAAAADALTGLAADALGLGRQALVQRLLDRAAVHAVDSRQVVRLHWVTAELALAQGAAAIALEHADTAVDLAVEMRSVRHRVKSMLLRAAALSCADRLPAARTEADRVDAECAAHRLTPLRWAAAMLRAGIASDPVSAQRAAAVAHDCAATIDRHGGHFRAST